MVHDDGRLKEAAFSIERAIGNLLISSDSLILPVEIGGKANTVEVAEAIAATLGEE